MIWTKEVFGVSVFVSVAVLVAVFFHSPVQQAEALETKTFSAAAAPENCALDCDRVRYVPYLVNPNGNVRTGDNPEHAYSFINPDGLEIIRMEDSNIDNDYQDVELVVNRTNCEQISINVRLVSAIWHHKIGVKIYYDEVLLHDEILWTDSHLAVGQTRVVNLRDASQFETFCVVPPVAGDPNFVSQENQCGFDCNAAGLYMYIVNPDGSQRHTQSIYAQTRRLGPRQFDIHYDDSGSDFDYNDVMLSIDARDCRAMKAQVKEVLADWHHQIRARVIYNNTTINDVLIWPDSHEVVGETVSIDILQYIPACVE